MENTTQETGTPVTPFERCVDLEWTVESEALTDGSEVFKVVGSGDGSGHQVHIECVDETEALTLQAILIGVHASYIE